MGSPETCEKCGGVGRHVEGKRGFTRFPCPNATPTPPGAAPDAASGPKAPPRMPAPADARPMVVGGAFVKFDRPTPADDARIYPCADCGLMRSRSEGGTTFTVCDVCWDKAYPTAPAPDAGARIEEAHRALGKPGRMDDDGCCVGCGRSVQPSPCCPDFPVWPGPCRSCYAYDEEQRDAGAAEDHTSEARRDHGAEGSHRAVVEAARALLADKRRDGCLYCVCGRLMTGNVEHQANCAWNRLDAALRGTKGGE